METLDLLALAPPITAAENIGDEVQPNPLNSDM